MGHPSPQSRQERRFQVAEPLGSKAGHSCCTDACRCRVLHHEVSADHILGWNNLGRARRTGCAGHRLWRSWLAETGLARSRRPPRELRRNEREGGGKVSHES